MHAAPSMVDDVVRLHAGPFADGRLQQPERGIPAARPKDIDAHDASFMTSHVSWWRSSVRRASELLVGLRFALERAERLLEQRQQRNTAHEIARTAQRVCAEIGRASCRERGKNTGAD